MTTRRSFLLSSLAALGSGACATAATAGRGHSSRRHDIVLRGGTIHDGTGTGGYEGDVAILAGRISAMSAGLAGRASDVIDVSGLVVAPGFIDIHSHADGTLFDDPRAESVIRQGITTAVVGQDGSSRAPNASDTPATRFATFAALFDSIAELEPAINIASMVGLGTVRGIVVGNDDRTATGDEIARMTALVQAALDDGACGASSGLEYTPGGFATRDELIALSRPLSRRRLCYATHMRNEDDHLLEAIDEAIAVARGAGARLQISHLKTQGPRNWDRIGPALDRIERAHASGLDIAFDRYPYIAYSTGLSNLFPQWTRDGGRDAFIARLGDPSLEARIREAVLAKVQSIGGWDNAMITSVSDGRDRGAEGQRLGSYAAGMGADPYDTTVGLLTRSGGSVGMVGFAMTEENTARFLAHPLGMVCSDGGAYALDGPARSGHPHPRGLGAFPRVLGHYVRELGALGLPEAIHKMSGFPAARAGLTGRGLLAPGYAADVVVFDPATVSDRATFADPFQYPVGIRHVLVNGVPAMRDGERLTQRAGHVLRPGGAR
ncbi:MAG: N-acyl-D-amino-acid deacylase family protein [Gemmatimonadaceae bacterium]